MWFPVFVVLTAIVTPTSPSPDIVNSSQVREDPVAGKKAEAEFKKHLLREDRGRQLRFDRTHLRTHKQIVALFQKARSRYERAQSKRALEKAGEAAHTIATVVRRRIDEMDHWRNGSKIFADYDALLAMIEVDYPAAVAASLNGDKGQLKDVQSAFAARMKTITDWLTEAAAYVDEED